VSLETEPARQLTESPRLPSPAPAAHAPPDQPQNPNAAAGEPRRSRLLRGITAPLRYARRRPARAALGLLGLAGLVLALAAAGVLLWFNHHLRQAGRAIDRWHNAEAFTHLSACRDVWPGHPEVLVYSARLARRVAAWDEAQALLDRYALEYGQDDTWAFESLLSRAARGETDATAAGLRARIAAGGAEARLAREALVLGLTNRFRMVDANAVLTEWLRETPDDLIALLLFGKLMENIDNQDQAIQIYHRVIELDPDLLDARLQLGSLHLDRRRGEEAAEQLSVLQARLPDNPDVQVLWSQALRLLGRADEARSVLAAVAARFPEQPRVLAERGAAALLEPDGGPEAELLLGKAAHLDPSSIPVRNQYALALGRNGKTAEAAEQYKQIQQLKADSDRFRHLINGPLQSSPRDPAVLHELGMIALRGGQTRDAIWWFERAIEADPNHLASHRVLAAVYKELGKPGLGSHHWAIAQRLAAQQPKN
jgi:Flp pilus assembly protein TadD